MMSQQFCRARERIFQPMTIEGGPRIVGDWSKTTLNYWVMVERYPNLKEEVGGWNPDYEISSLPDGKLAR
jgi:hypothetical protein